MAVLHASKRLHVLLVAPDMRTCMHDVLLRFDASAKRRRCVRTSSVACDAHMLSKCSTPRPALSAVPECRNTGAGKLAPGLQRAGPLSRARRRAHLSSAAPRGTWLAPARQITMRQPSMRRTSAGLSTLTKSSHSARGVRAVCGLPCAGLARVSWHGSVTCWTA